MIVRSNRVFRAITYEGKGTYRNDHVWSIATPIIGEESGEENKWPATGRLGTLEECKPENIRYSVHNATFAEDGKYWDLRIGDIILEEDGCVVSVVTPKTFKQKFEEVI